MAATLDTFFQRYHWDYWTYLDQPEWLIQELAQVIQAEGQYHEARQKENHSGRPNTPPPAKNHEDLMVQAGAAGFLQLEPPED